MLRGYSIHKISKECGADCWVGSYEKELAALLKLVELIPGFYSPWLMIT